MPWNSTSRALWLGNMMLRTLRTRTVLTLLIQVGAAQTCDLRRAIPCTPGRAHMQMRFAAHQKQHRQWEPPSPTPGCTAQTSASLHDTEKNSQTSGRHNSATGRDISAWQVAHVVPETEPPNPVVSPCPQAAATWCNTHYRWRKHDMMSNTCSMHLLKSTA